MAHDKIGPREQALRDLRARNLDRYGSRHAPKKLVAQAHAALPKTTGKKPVKRKAKRRG